MDRFLASGEIERLIITGVNADPGYQTIRDLISNYASKWPEKVTCHESLGIKGYLSTMKEAAAVVGNSSSGIIEAPAMGVPTVNIGPRQDGRLKAASVFDCGESEDEIFAALRLALTPNSKKKTGQQQLPYGAGGAATEILRLLKSVDLRPPIRKRFFEGVA